MAIQSPQARVKNEKGYVFVLFSLLMVVLIAFTGFGVDLGSWYATSLDLQKAADASALAGVVYMPDTGAAIAVARKTAQQNGYVDGQNNISITYTPKLPNRLNVSIKDSNVQTYFTRVFVNNLKETRLATAEYVLPLPLGSPSNVFGTGGLTFGGTFTPTDFWAGVSGFCTAKELGDKVLSWTDGNSWNGCPSPEDTGPGPINPGFNTGDTFNASGSHQQPDYDARGYTYVIEVPPSAPIGTTLQVYDADFCPKDPATTPSFSVGDPKDGWNYKLYGSTIAQFHTDFQLEKPDATPLNDYDNPPNGPVFTSGTNTASTAPGCLGWQQVGTPMTQQGQYILHVSTRQQDHMIGHNNFALWAKRPGDAKPCDAVTDFACPKVFARKDMSITINKPNSSGNFYLAQIGPQYAGKKLVIDLWDAADGMNSLQVLDPGGNAIPFTWSTVDGYSGAAPDYTAPGQDSSSTNCTPTPCLDVSKIGPAPGLGRPGPAGWFNDRTIEIVAQLPSTASGWTANPAWAVADNWYKIRYMGNTADLYDRTTWSAHIGGKPVHLVE